MDSYLQYATWIKPSWAPPAWLFGPVWSVLYLLIAVSFSYVFYRAAHGSIPLLVALPFALNLVFNIAFTPLQFGLGSLWLSSIDIVLVFGTLAWALFVVYPHAPWVAFINVPYLLWVSFATVLQLSILVLNEF